MELRLGGSVDREGVAVVIAEAIDLLLPHIRPHRAGKRVRALFTGAHDERRPRIARESGGNEERAS